MAEGDNDDGPTIEELQEQLAAATKSIDGLSAKNQELLTETKTAKASKRKSDDAVLAEQQRLAQEQGDHKQLYESSQEQNKSLQTQLEEMQSGISKEKRNSAALKMATELADGDNVGLLSEFIGKRLKVTDEGLKVTDASGALTVSSLDDLKAEFKNNARYAALLKGNQSSGGGAPGGSEGSGAATTKTRAEFEALNHTGRTKFVKGGGKVTN